MGNTKQRMVDKKLCSEKYFLLRVINIIGAMFPTNKTNTRPHKNSCTYDQEKNSTVSTPHYYNNLSLININI